METRQIEKQLNRYVPDLNVPFEDLQKQLTAFIQAEREQLKARILKGKADLRLVRFTRRCGMQLFRRSTR